MSRLSILLGVSFLSMPSFGVAQDIEGSMRCEVMSNQVLEVLDGRPRTYSGIKDQFDVGDTLLLKYRAFASAETPGKFGTLLIQLVDEPRARVWMRGSGPVVPHSELNNFLILDQASEDIPRGVEGISFSPDYIRLASAFHGEIRLSRYYKSDWQGLAFNPNAALGADEAFSIHIFSLDCRQEIDRIEDVVHAFATN